jgi:hypothetical protein
MVGDMAKAPKNPERSFGVSVGGVLLLIAALLLWRRRLGRAEIVGGIGGVLLVLGLVSPSLLRYPSALWWRFSRALGYVNARILLTAASAVSRVDSIPGSICRSPAFRTVVLRTI